MNPHFSQPLFTLLSFGSGFKVQGSWFMVHGSWLMVHGSRGGFAAFFRRWYSRIAAFPLRGRCPEGADRALAA